MEVTVAKQMTIAFCYLQCRVVRINDLCSAGIRCTQQTLGIYDVRVAHSADLIGPTYTLQIRAPDSPSPSKHLKSRAWDARAAVQFVGLGWMLLARNAVVNIPYPLNGYLSNMQHV